MRKKMHLGMSIRGLGYHPAAWWHPDVPADGSLRFEHYARSAKAAERGKCDMVFFADGIGIRERDAPKGSLARSGFEIVEMEPMTLLPALAVVTEHIGLVTTASTTYNEPYHIARKFATLDLISNGRAGWNMVTSWSEAEARNFNRGVSLPGLIRPRRSGPRPAKSVTSRTRRPKPIRCRWPAKKMPRQRPVSRIRASHSPCATTN